MAPPPLPSAPAVAVTVAVKVWLPRLNTPLASNAPSSTAKLLSGPTTGTGSCGSCTVTVTMAEAVIRVLASVTVRRKNSAVGAAGAVKVAVASSASVRVWRAGLLGATGAAESSALSTCVHW